MQLDKPLLKFILMQVANYKQKDNFEEKEQCKWHIVLYIKTLYRDGNFKIIVLAKNKPGEQWNKIQSPETNSCLTGHKIM